LKVRRGNNPAWLRIAENVRELRRSEAVVQIECHAPRSACNGVVRFNARVAIRKEQPDALARIDEAARVRVAQEKTEPPRPDLKGGVRQRHPRVLVHNGNASATIPRQRVREWIPHIELIPRDATLNFMLRELRVA
jgi:hypothetical protein